MRAVATMSLGGLLFGFDTAVISGVTAALHETWRIGPAMVGTLVSAALWGTLAGAVFSGAPGDRYGARAVLRLVAAAYLLSAIGCAVAAGPWTFFVSRLLGGLAIGASSVLVPVYIAEISPADRRGRLVGLFQFNIVFGILAAYFVNSLIGQVAPAEIAWRLKLAAAALPAMLFLVLLFGVPQSPAWLGMRGRRKEAEEVAQRLGLAEPATAQSLEDGSQRLSWSVHRRPIVLAVLLALFNQLSGINAILYYLNDIFAAAGFGGLSADARAIAVGFANLLGTMAGIGLIDRIGRRPLLIAGDIVTAAALVGVALVFSDRLAAAWLLPLLVLFIIAFALSQGAVIWVYLSEIFPAAVRARGQALGSATHWAANAVISLMFPILAVGDRAAPFWVFAVFMLVQSVLVWRLFPETRRRALGQLVGRMTPRDPAGDRRSAATNQAAV